MAITCHLKDMLNTHTHTLTERERERERETYLFTVDLNEGANSLFCIVLER